MRAMKLALKTAYHDIFTIVVTIKLLSGVVEVISGILLFFISHATFVVFFSPLIHTSLWYFARPLLHSFSVSGKTFWAAFLFVHGAANIFLSLMLFKKKSWAYPAAASVFGLFDIYQIATFIHRPTLVLGIFTIFDLVVIGLILNEYRYARKIAKKLTI
jgi:uncharacterized membrane protein